ncbi:MAG TPA: HEAT repeat domain-containing protein [Candidatus Binatia bacterium]|nr:HEAT repeat domain-containing protein [Candidatus Binatia bacterium]
MDIHDKRITALISALADSDKTKIRAAVDALVALAADSAGVRAALEQRLNGPHGQNHWTLAYVLGHLSQPSGPVIQMLLDALDHADPEIRWAIAVLLVRLGKSDAAVVGRLLDLCATGTPTERRMAVYCVRDLELSDKLSLESLLNALQDPEPMVRVAAVTSLKARTDVDENGRGVLLDLFLRDRDVRVRSVAAITLAVLGSPSEKFLAALDDAAASDHAQIKKAAFAALSLLHNKRPAPSGS